MMKDYYKILGVEEEASGEEIRARWTELIKHYHPDLGNTEGDDERVKEINEAYEILKNESTRFDYDLERALKRSIVKKTPSAKERRMNIQKIILPAGILVLFLIAGLVSLRWFHVASSRKSEVLYEIDKILEKKPVSEIPPVKTESKVQENREVPQEIKKKEVIPPESKKIVSVPPPRSPSGVESESKKKEESAPKILQNWKPPVKVEGKALTKEEPKPAKELVPQVAMKSGAPVRVEREIPREVSKEILKEVPKEALKEALKEVPEEVPKEIAKEVPKEVAGVTLHPGEKLAIKTEEEKRFANEEEVKQFFSSYIRRYNRKDIDGFLSFFSSKAVQNQRDGLKQIKNIYTKFFDESQELRYLMEGMKIEIYQNTVEVKARFRVDQTLKRRGEEKVWTGTIHWVLVKEDGTLKIISLNYQNQKSP